MRKAIDEGISKVRDEICKEFSVDNLRKEFATEIASLRADMTIQVASLRADITTRKVQPTRLKERE